MMADKDGSTGIGFTIDLATMGTLGILSELLYPSANDLDISVGNAPTPPGLSA